MKDKNLYCSVYSAISLTKNPKKPIITPILMVVYVQACCRTWPAQRPAADHTTRTVYLDMAAESERRFRPASHEGIPTVAFIGWRKLLPSSRVGPQRISVRIVSRF
ncbi:hypothetical protein Baya_11644 [Bagarius yarrelli]|uniref:Uncharacterized protein n=1 Tax=Bagarius yarrelli TaxID=175774 RepID=A0A556V0Y8_BAGYA|nr:hypothetical protein Baya_11644 [Bagarius yarrelli]